MTRRPILPAHLSTSPLHLVLQRYGLSTDAPQDVLLATLLRFAAKVERKASPWDATGPDLIGTSASAHLAAGAYSVHVDIWIDRYTPQPVRGPKW
ncbi:hypothetical protein [Kitasatospora sp. NPDC005751]|uniref:hypothetical protein n=1 Tax=Kitasatospora sp. NPDC005751 TaxID=3157064 RepID=UPI0033E20426